MIKTDPLRANLQSVRCMVKSVRCMVNLGAFSNFFFFISNTWKVKYYCIKYWYFNHFNSIYIHLTNISTIIILLLCVKVQGCPMHGELTLMIKCPLMVYSHIICQNNELLKNMLNYKFDIINLKDPHLIMKNEIVK